MGSCLDRANDHHIMPLDGVPLDGVPLDGVDDRLTPEMLADVFDCDNRFLYPSASRGTARVA